MGLTQFTAVDNLSGPRRSERHAGVTDALAPQGRGPQERGRGPRNTDENPWGPHERSGSRYLRRAGVNPPEPNYERESDTAPEKPEKRQRENQADNRSRQPWLTPI